MSIEQKRRELFERAYSKLDQQAAEHLLFIRDDGQYGYHTTRTAWACFNSALDAVEIELPKRIVDWSTDSWGDGFNVSRDRCKEAIESTGLGIKVKP